MNSKDGDGGGCAQKRMCLKESTSVSTSPDVFQLKEKPHPPTFFLHLGPLGALLTTHACHTGRSVTIPIGPHLTRNSTL